MGDLDGRSFLVTGANSGIGRATARVLACRGGRVVLAGRSATGLRETRAALAQEAPSAELDVLLLDLADLASVRRAAATYLATGRPLHVLVNNAGVAGAHGITADGFEIAFGTNYLGHFLLTELLLDRLAEDAPARVVNVTSGEHLRPSGIDWEAVRRPTATNTGFHEYCVSKLANVLHAQELARRVADRGVTTYAVHPGGVATGIWREVPGVVRVPLQWFLAHPERGARTSLHCATAPGLASVSGRYYEHSREKPPSTVATPELASELWERTEAWLREA